MQARDRAADDAMTIARSTWIAAIALSLVFAFARTAAAADKKTENAAQDAMKKAYADYSAGKVDAALGRLQKALEACGTSKCSAGTKAVLLRDVGVMEAKKGDEDASASAFVEALKIDSTIELGPYDSPQLRPAWDAAKEEAAASKVGQPSGDFGHTPPPMQAVKTPLPIFFEYAGSTPLATVTLRYKATGMREYKRMQLTKMKGGWGGTIPCADVARGVMRYYVQGMSADGSPVAGNGSAREPYWVAIRPKIHGDAPHLPGSPPPAACTESSASEPVREEPRRRLDVGAACDEDAQCDSGRCKDGECIDAEVKRKEVTGDYARWWIGASGSIDFVPLSAADDVCKLTNQGVPANAAGYYCTYPDGPDFPSRATPAQNATLPKGGAGSTTGGIGGRDVRAMVSIDYAFSASFLVGARLGWVINPYTGTQAQHDGHGFSTPIHFEARATYLFGEQPLARSGAAPYVFVGGGVTQLDAVTTVQVAQNGIAGQRPYQAWLVAGPLFFAAGGGARYAFSPRAAMLAGLRFMGALGGSGGMLPAFAPEMTLQYGF